MSEISYHLEHCEQEYLNRQIFFFSGSSQLWKNEANDNVLKNNANLWKSNDEFEVEFKNEYILIRNNTNLKVLTVHNEPDLIEQNFEEGETDQLWIKEDSHIDGFFTLKNLKWDKYLTAVSKSSLQVQGKNLMEFGTIIF